MLNARGDIDGALVDYKKAVELNPEVAQFEMSRYLVNQFKAKGKEIAGKSSASKSKKRIPTTDKALLLRTDFTNESAQGILMRRDKEPRRTFEAQVWISSAMRNSKSVTAKTLQKYVDDNYPFSFAFIVPTPRLWVSRTNPILVIDMSGRGALRELPGHPLATLGRGKTTFPLPIWALKNSPGLWTTKSVFSQFF